MIDSLLITPQDSLLLIIDIQERLAKVMKPKILDRVVDQTNLLATLAVETDIPIIVTEQYPKGLGITIDPIKQILKDKKYENHEKLTFGCCGDSAFNEKLKKYGRKKIILVGMETHVCVFLTALGLIENGYQPFVASDAVISRERFYYDNGLDLIRQAGGIVTNTETLLFQLMGQSGTPTFKKISALLKHQSIK